MDSIYEKIYDRLAASSEFIAYNGENNIWEENTPDDNSVPTTVIKLSSSDLLFKDTPLEDETLDVEYWDRTKTKIYAVEKILINLLDGLRDDLTDVIMFYLRRETLNRIYEDDGNIWHLVIRYSIRTIRK